MKDNKLIIFILVLIVMPLLFYAIFQFGKNEQKKIQSKYDQIFIDSVKAEARDKALKDVQEFLKKQGIDIVDGRKFKK